MALERIVYMTMGRLSASLLCVIAFCLFSDVSGFSLRVEETFRIEDIKAQHAIYFIQDGKATKQLGSIADSEFVRFDEEYTYVAMEWNRFPNETIDYTLSFASDNTSILLTPTTNVPVDSCIPSTQYTEFRMNLDCTGVAADTITFTAIMNYTIRQYVFDVPDYRSDLNHFQCIRERMNLTGGRRPAGAITGSAKLEMNKICAMRVASETNMPTATLIGIIVGSVAGLLLISIFAIFIVRIRTLQKRAQDAEMVSSKSSGKHDNTSDRFSDANSSYNPQYSRPSLNGSGGGYGVASPYDQHGQAPAFFNQQVEIGPLMERMCLKWKDCVEDSMVPRSAILVGEEIGRGAFGRVCLGNVILDNMSEPVPCAIKTLKAAETVSDVDEFLEEAVMLKDFHHPNVMSLLAVTLDTEDLPMVCLEFMHHGDLRTYLRKMRGSFSNLLEEPQMDNSKLLLNFCSQIAHGMDYLSSQNFVHRDLAARNCMLNKNLEVKIGDFGLARDIDKDNYYRMGTARPLPVKWMALESMTLQVFTVQSDVWAFGVVMWEIFSMGITPYAGVANHEMLDVLKQNIRLPPPDGCPVEVFKYMSVCWSPNPEARPTFSELAQILEDCGERLYENMPVHITQTDPNYQNCEPGPPGSIVRQSSGQNLRRTPTGSQDAYNRSMAPYNMDKYEVMGPVAKKTSNTSQPQLDAVAEQDGVNGRDGFAETQDANCRPDVLIIDRAGQGRSPVTTESSSVPNDPDDMDEPADTHYKNPPAPLKYVANGGKADRIRIRNEEKASDSDASSSSV